MYEEVTITKVLSEDLVEVTCASAACAGCKGSGFCNAKDRSFKAGNNHQLAVDAGESIHLYLHPAKTIGSTLITLITPLLFFPICYYLAQRAGAGEGLSFLLSLGGIVLGFGIVGLFFKSRQKQYMPIVERLAQTD